jgi:hypothetical protein
MTQNSRAIAARSVRAKKFDKVFSFIVGSL